MKGGRKSAIFGVVIFNLLVRVAGCSGARVAPPFTSSLWKLFTFLTRTLGKTKNGSIKQLDRNIKIIHTKKVYIFIVLSRCPDIPDKYLNRTLLSALHNKSQCSVVQKTFSLSPFL